MFHDNTTPSNQVEHIVVNDDKFVKDVNCICLNERPIEDVENDESTSNFSSEKEFVPTQDEGLNEP